MRILDELDESAERAWRMSHARGKEREKKSFYSCDSPFALSHRAFLPLPEAHSPSIQKNDACYAVYDKVWFSSDDNQIKRTHLSFKKCNESSIHRSRRLKTQVSGLWF